MTMTLDIGKLKANLEYISFGKQSREVELEVIWVSCGVYQIAYNRPIDAKPHYVLAVDDWHPPNVSVSITPEQFNKVVELYPDAPKQPRKQCWKPFYEDFSTDPGMFDLEHDMLFQAYKDPHEGADKVYLVNRYFVHGIPDSNNQVLGLFVDDFKKLKDLIDGKKDEIFYSGCKVEW